MNILPKAASYYNSLLCEDMGTFKYMSYLIDLPTIAEVLSFIQFTKSLRETGKLDEVVSEYNLTPQTVRDEVHKNDQLLAEALNEIYPEIFDPEKTDQNFNVDTLKDTVISILQLYTSYTANELQEFHDQVQRDASGSNNPIAGLGDTL